MTEAVTKTVTEALTDSATQATTEAAAEATTEAATRKPTENPTANATANPGEPPTGKPTNKAAAQSAAKAAAKPPAPEEAPFSDFIPKLYLPALAQEIRSYGGAEPTLRFEQGPMPVVGAPCWMVIGALPGDRRFWLCFTAADINAAKTVALAECGAEPTLLESFLIDEKKMSLALLVSRLVQRLNGQKWLGPN